MTADGAMPLTEPQAYLSAQVLDVAVVMRRVDCDRKLLNELVQVLFEELPPMLECLEQSVAKRDALKTEHLAHAIKGSVGVLAAAPATEAARRLELIGHQGNMAAAPEACAWLLYELSRLVSALALLVEEET